MTDPAAFLMRMLKSQSKAPAAGSINASTDLAVPSRPPATASSTDTTGDPATAFSAAEPGPAGTGSGSLSRFTSTASNAVAAAAAAGISPAGSSTPRHNGQVLPQGPSVEYNMSDKTGGEPPQQLEVAQMSMLRYESIPAHLQQIAAGDVFIAYALKNNHIRLLSVAESVKGIIKLHNARILDLSFFSAKGDVLASSSADGAVTIHALTLGDSALPEAPVAVSLLHSLMVGPSDGEACVRLSWHPKTSDVVFVAMGDTLAALVLTQLPAHQPDNTLTIGLGADDRLPGVCPLPWAPVSPAAVTSNIAISADGRLAALGTKDGRVVVFDLPAYSDSAAYVGALTGPTCGVRGDVVPFEGAAVTAVHWVSAEDGGNSPVLVTAAASGKELVLIHAHPDDISILQRLTLVGTAPESTIHGLAVHLVNHLLLVTTEGNMLHTLQLQGSQSSTRFAYAASFKLAHPILSMCPAEAASQEAGKQVLWLYSMQTNGVNRLTLDPAQCRIPGPAGPSDGPASTAASPAPSTATALLLSLPLASPANPIPSVPPPTPATSTKTPAGLLGERVSEGQGRLEGSAGTSLTDALLGLANGSRNVEESASSSNRVGSDNKRPSRPSSRNLEPPLSPPNPPDALLLPSGSAKSLPGVPQTTPAADEAAGHAATDMADEVDEDAADDPAAASQDDALEEGELPPGPAPEVHVHRADSRMDAAPHGAPAAEAAPADLADAVSDDSDQPVEPASPPAREVEPPSAPVPLPAVSPPHPTRLPPHPPFPRVPSPASAPSTSASAAAPTASTSRGVCPTGAADGPVGPGMPPAMESELAALRRRLDSLERTIRERDRTLLSQLRNDQRQEVSRLSDAFEKTTNSSVSKLMKGQGQALQAERTSLLAHQRSETDRLMVVVGNVINKDLPARLQDIVRTQLEQALPGALAQALPSALNSKALEQAVASQVSAAVTRQLQDSFRSAFQKQALPAFEAATGAMFQQIQGAVAQGLTEHVAASERAVAALAQQVQQATQQLSAAAHSMQQAAASPALGRGKDRRPVAAATAAADFRPQLESFLGKRDYEEAFRQALQAANNQEQVLWLVKKVGDPAAAIGNTALGTALTQPVLVALAKQLATDLAQDTAVKLTWIREAALALDPPAEEIKDFVPSMLTPVHHALQELVASRRPEAADARVIMHIVNSVVLSAK